MTLICSFENCEKSAKGKGALCNGHYQQKRKNKELTPLYVPRTGCIVEGCDRKHHSQGRCSTHHAQFMVRGTTELDIRNISAEHAVKIAWLEKTSVNLECKLWKWSHGPKGYGTIRIGKKTYSTHRYVLEKTIGRPISPGKFACHTCDTPSCCNPLHLYEGTPQQNSADMVLRKRSTGAERSPMRKKTCVEVAEIIHLSQSTPVLQIATMYNISARTVRDYVSGRRWKCYNNRCEVHGVQTI